MKSNKNLVRNAWFFAKSSRINASVRAGAVVPAIIVQVEDPGVDDASERGAEAIDIPVFWLCFDEHGISVARKHRKNLNFSFGQPA